MGSHNVFGPTAAMELVWTKYGMSRAQQALNTFSVPVEQVGKDKH